MEKICEKSIPNKHISVALDELLQLGNGAKRLSFSALKSKRATGGGHLTRFQGRGMEFAESRPYQIGDDVRNIDWRITARTGKPHTKLFCEEKQRQILLLVDMREAMMFATQGSFKSVQAATLAGYIAWNASLMGNRMGGIVFNDTGHIELRPKLGRKGLLPFLEALVDKGEYKHIDEPKKTTFTFQDAISRLGQVAAPGSIVFMLSDFRNLSNEAIEIINQTSRHVDIALCFIYDPLEANLPKNGLYAIENNKQKLKLNTFDAQSLRAYHEKFHQREEMVRALATNPRIHFMKCSTVEDCFLCLKQYFQ